MGRSYVITGGAGFIGSNLVHSILEAEADAAVTVLDRLTYAGNRENLASFDGDPRMTFLEGDVCDLSLVREVLSSAEPDVIFHLAAESHVDRSIDGPGAFVRTNVEGTYAMLEATRAFLTERPREGFRFVHVSTDEVFGSLGPTGAFGPASPYAPRSPYAASKAAADHLVRAWLHTFGVPTIVTNCSNNYGPRQYPEKLLPLMILQAVEGKPLPVYGDGGHVRDWLHVDDHCAGLRLVSERGVPGETYLFGGHGERTNLELVRAVCAILDARLPSARPRSGLITFVADRPGHDRRYAIDASQTERALGWRPRIGLDEGLARTVDWYLENRAWSDRIAYRRERLGLGGSTR
ncbi:MAG: dTDP-glucose 4,6-dehydratase [Deltaproteobacteria bacterium]|nr:dTDP-glucose 4,6-dehydratase [Deltaproteobacteria bacterium]